MEKSAQADNVLPPSEQQSVHCDDHPTEVNLGPLEYQLERGLESHHLQFLALGGAIGTGLFIGSGGLLASTGPAPLFMSYLIMIVLVWIVMNCLAEMVTYLPLRGISIPYFVKRFVDPSLAFAVGWNYWYAYTVLVGAEAVAASIIIEYWSPPVHSALWIAIVLLVMLVLNIIAVNIFGEAEFWFASIKVITICGLIILGIVIFFGRAPDQGGILGFSYWKNPGSFKSFGAEGSLGRFLGFWHTLILSSFAFLTSPELIAIAAGEAKAPRRNIPKAARRFIWRLSIFYGLSSLIVGIICPSDNQRLLSPNSDASASPFVIGIQLVGIPILNHIINAAVLTSAWSAGNSFLYSGSRVLYSLSLSGEAPKIFSKTTKAGVPWVAVLVTWSGGLLAFLNISNSSATVFNWLVNIAIVAGLIAWIVVTATYIRFRCAMVAHNMLDVLPYRTPLQPYAAYFACGMFSLLTLTNGFNIFLKGNWAFNDFVAAYVTIPIFLAFYLGHKVWKRTPFYIKTENVDCVTGKREMDELERQELPRVPRNRLEKVWHWIA